MSGTGTVTGPGPGGGLGGPTLVAVSGGAPQDAISTYCIGLYKAKKALSTIFSDKEFKYYPNITIEKVEKDKTDANHVLITIKGGNQEATMHYSGFKNLLNASPKELIENATIPTSVVSLSGDVNADIKDFVKQITDYSYVPFCMIMQFYMNPDSILTKAYSPYELSLMSELSFVPKENKKGELMCYYNDALIVGTDFLATPATTEIPPSIKTFDDLKGIKLKKPALAPILKNGKYDINHSSLNLAASTSDLMKHAKNCEVSEQAFVMPSGRVFKFKSAVLTWTAGKLISGWSILLKSSALDNCVTRATTNLAFAPAQGTLT